ncbi:MAG: polysaccharide biosynthesis C-terminal domain-containing protein [Eubacteriales bacterium]|nr:polysaccharide biosynthesis C-terminal domain-containing protein [Eubacteriales bacterium]
MNNSKFLKNVVTGFGGQLIAIVLGIIVPRIFIISYGSDINGLIGTISQIFTYLALLEAGIGQAAQNLLYKPVKEKNKIEISNICSSSSSYFKKLTVFYGIGVILLSLCLPFILKTNVDFTTIFLIVMFEGLSGVVSFYYIETPSILIAVDGKSYINNTITLLSQIVGYGVKITLASFGASIVFVQLAYFLIAVAKVSFYKAYFQKKYGWIDLQKKGKRFNLKDRNFYIITEITWTIFSSTDMIVLSAFVSTQMSSVYGIYNMIFTNINVLLNTVYNSIKYILGQIYHESTEKYILIHDAFNSIFLGTITALMTISYILCIPFIKLYTAEVIDINYIIEELPFLFCLIQLLSWSRYVSGNLVGIAGRIKKAVWVNIVEALLNVTFSIILVQRFGIIGVLFATVIALPLKLIYCNYVGDRIILKRNSWNTIKILGSNFIIFILGVIVNQFINLNINSYVGFIVIGILISIIIFIITVVVNVMVNPSVLKLVNKFVIRR